jgi:hypothetical protein
VTVSSSLKWHSHCANLHSSATRMVNLIFKCFKTRDKVFLTKLFVAFVRSKLEYCSSVWSPQFISDIDLIESVQRYFTRRVCNDPSLTYWDRLKALSLQPLELRRLHADLMLTYKLLHRTIPVDYKQFFELKRDVSRVTRGHELQIFKVRQKSTLTAHFYSNRIVNVWNELPHNVVLAPTISSFKSRLLNVDLSPFLRGSALRDLGGGPRRL